MRLDKYLKVSRLIKRRTVANEACDAGRVLLNDKPARASAAVKAGDIVEIQFGGKSVKVEVLDVKETVRKEEAESMFRYLQFLRLFISAVSYIVYGKKQWEAGPWKRKRQCAPTG